MTMTKILPWILAAILAAASVALHFYYKGIVEAKDAEIRSVTDKYNELVVDANTKLKAAGDQIKGANTRAEQIASEANSKIQAFATEANDKLQAANLPEVTVSLSFRKAILGNGSVAMIKNTSPQAASISLAFLRTSTNQQKTIDTVIDSSKTKEIGEREGWAFLQGDTIQVSQPGHKTT